METKGVGCGRDACISCSVCYSILRAFPICTHRCMQTLIGKTSLRLKKYHMVLISIRCNRSLQYFRFINGSRRSSSHQLHSFGVLHTFQSASAGIRRQYLNRSYWRNAQSTHGNRGRGKSALEAAKCHRPSPIAETRMWPDPLGPPLHPTHSVS